MKKTYRISPIAPIFFFAAMLAYTLLTQPITLTNEWFINQSFLLIPTAIGCLLLVTGQVITISNKKITRSNLFRQTYSGMIADIISVKEDAEGRGIYRFNSIKVTFKDGYSFNIFWLSTKKMKDFIAQIRAIVPEAVDTSVDRYIAKPY